jgi:hypothetical protein
MLVLRSFTHHRLFICLLLVGVLAVSGISPVQADEPKAATDQKTEEPKFVPARPPDGGPVLKPRRRRPNDQIVAILLRQYDTLQATIHKQLELKPEQAKAIDAVIDAYRKRAREETRLIGLFHASTAARFHGGRFGPQSAPPVLDLTSSALQPAQGRKTASAAQKEIRDGDFYEYHDMILSDIYFSVDDTELRARLWPALIRWLTLNRPPAHRDGPMLRILRSVRDPELDVDDEERAELISMISEKMQEHAQNRYKKVILKPVADELRSDVAKKLAPRQREHFLKTLKLLEEENEVVERLVAEVEAKKVAKASKSAENEKEN